MQSKKILELIAGYKETPENSKLIRSDKKTSLTKFFGYIIKGFCRFSKIDYVSLGKLF